MFSLLILIPNCILGLVFFFLDLYALHNYKRMAYSLPKTEETYKKLLFQEDLWGCLNFFIFFPSQMALVMTDMIMSNWKTAKFSIYFIAVGLSFIAGMSYWSFVLTKKREKLFLTLTEKADYNLYKNSSVNFYFEGMAISLGNFLGLFVILVFWALL